MSNQVPSIYANFNARTSSIKKLCVDFIYNSHYSKIASQDHSILVGPRGSGKTTLMRMLSLEALSEWEGTEAERVREQLGFNGIFIPTDRLWKRQYNYIKDSEKIKSTDIKYLDSLFIYHIFENLLDTLSLKTTRTPKQKHLFRHMEIDKEQESILTIGLSKLWGIRPDINSLKSLKIALIHKKKEISDYFHNLMSEENNIESPNTISSDISNAIFNSIDIINATLEKTDEKWCFLFDELELAPDHLIEPLIQSMRGGSINCIFKLALCPYHKNLKIFNSSEGVMSNQDSSFIRLTEMDARSGEDFSRKIFQSVLKKNDIEFEDLDEKFSADPTKSIDKDFKALSVRDKSFNEYLNNQKIDPENLSVYSEKEKRTIIRKIQEVVHVRNLYFEKKSRKRPPDYYSGIKNIFKSVEYNPRMLIGMANEFSIVLLDKKTVDNATQIKVISDFLSSFSALLSTLIIEKKFDLKNKKIESVYDLIEFICLSSKSEIIGENFNPEPRISIRFSSDNTRPGLEEAIGDALNAGALIEVKDKESRELSDLNQVRVRLSYLFSHKNYLLMSLPRERSSSDLFSNDNDSPEEKSQMSFEL